MLAIDSFLYSLFNQYGDFLFYITAFSVLQISIGGFFLNPIFEKAGVKDYIVPILMKMGIAELLKLVRVNPWMTILLFIPIVNLSLWFIICLRLSAAFRGGKLIGILLFAIPIVGFPLLAYGPYNYVGYDTRA